MLTLAVGLHLAAAPAQSVPSIVRAQQLEVVDADGTVVFRVRATEAGGRLEVKNRTGATIFSTGSDPEAPQRFGLWEQSRQTLATQRREIERQRRELNHLIARLQEFERQSLKPSRATPRGNDFAQYRSALARQDRDIDNLERRVSQLARQLNLLERRQ